MTETCMKCNGKGGRWDNESIDHWYSCEECSGLGKITKTPLGEMRDYLQGRLDFYNMQDNDVYDQEIEELEEIIGKLDELQAKHESPDSN